MNAASVTQSLVPTIIIQTKSKKNHTERLRREKPFTSKSVTRLRAPAWHEPSIIGKYCQQIKKSERKKQQQPSSTINYGIDKQVKWKASLAEEGVKKAKRATLKIPRRKSVPRVPLDNNLVHLIFRVCYVTRSA